MVSLAFVDAAGDFVAGLFRFNRVLVLRTGMGVTVDVMPFRRGGFIGVTDSDDNPGVTVRWVADVIRPGVRVSFVVEETLDGFVTGVFNSRRQLLGTTELRQAFSALISSN